MQIFKNKTNNQLKKNKKKINIKKRTKRKIQLKLKEKMVLLTLLPYKLKTKKS